MVLGAVLLYNELSPLSLILIVTLLSECKKVKKEEKEKNKNKIKQTSNNPFTQNRVKITPTEWNLTQKVKTTCGNMLQELNFYQ